MIKKWKDLNIFSRDYRMCEAIYGRTVSDLAISRAYNRYWKIYD